MAEGGPSKGYEYSTSVDSGFIGSLVDESGPLIGGRQIGNSQFFGHSMNTGSLNNGMSDSGFVTGPVNNSNFGGNTGSLDNRGSVQNSGSLGKNGSCEDRRFFGDNRSIEDTGLGVDNTEIVQSVELIYSRTIAKTGFAHNTNSMENVPRVCPLGQVINIEPVDNSQTIAKQVINIEPVEPMDTGGAGNTKDVNNPVPVPVPVPGPVPGCNPGADNNSQGGANNIQGAEFMDREALQREHIQDALPREYRRVPANCLRPKTRKFLNRRMTPKVSQSDPNSYPRDFRGFAQLIGMGQADIRYYDDDRFPAPFLMAFDDWCEDEDPTLGQFIDVLGRLGKFDILGSDDFKKLIGMFIHHVLGLLLS